MAVQVGITEPQARKLLELGALNNIKPKVRTFRKTSSQHCGRAFLLEVFKNQTARIQPLTHRKEETVSLNELRLWKSGNSFSIDEVIEMQPQQQIKATGSVVSAQSSSYVIFSKKMGGIWGGFERRWVKNLSIASKWGMDFKHHAERTMSKISVGSEQTDYVIMTEEEAQLALLDVMTAPSTPLGKIGNDTVAPLPSLLQTLVPSKPHLTVTSSSDDFLDLEALSNPNEQALRNAEQERRVLSEKYLATKQELESIREKIFQVNERVLSLGGRSIVKTKKVSSGSNKGCKSGAPRGALKGGVIAVLKTHSRLDADGIHQRLLSNLPSADVNKVKGALLAMRADGEAERDDKTQGWCLTAKGRAWNLE